MNIYKDKLSECLGIRPITYYIPNYNFNVKRPKDATQAAHIGSITPTPKGGKLSEEHKKALRVPRPGAGLHDNHAKGEKHFAKRIITCPHCKKQGGGGSMKRWHFDNCKSSDKYN